MHASCHPCVLHVQKLTKEQNDLLILGWFLREDVITIVALAMMSLHGGSARGTCGCRPVVGPTTIAPLQRRLGIHHDVGGNCSPPGHYNSPQVNGCFSRSAKRYVHTSLLSANIHWHVSKPEIQLRTDSNHWTLRTVTDRTLFITLTRLQ